jgi:hypothetical protein
MFSDCGVGVEPRTPQNLIRISSWPHGGRVLAMVNFYIQTQGKCASIAGLVHSATVAINAKDGLEAICAPLPSPMP